MELRRGGFIFGVRVLAYMLADHTPLSTLVYKPVRTFDAPCSSSNLRMEADLMHTRHVHATLLLLFKMFKCTRWLVIKDAKHAIPTDMHR